MKSVSSRLLAHLALAAALVAQAGCPANEAANGPAPPPSERDGEKSPGDDGPTGQADTPPRRKPEPPPKPTMPDVVLTEEQKATRLVDVGEGMPDGELTGMDGGRQALSGLFGPRLTVVFFWNVGETLRAQMVAETALGDLARDVAAAYAEKGVRVVGVNVGDAPAAARRLIEAAEADFPILFDSQGELFSKVATEGLPRIFLLDADGKILWFDLEYSQTTHDALRTAIQVVLGE
jgi:peroxiredoxin